NIVLGILIAFISNYLLSGIEHNAWRWMVGVEAIPALIYTLMVIGVPRSPRWLIIHRHAIEEARGIMQRINPAASPGEIDTAIDAIVANEAESKREGAFSLKRYQFLFLLAFLIAFFNQFSGINAFLYYAPRIFEEAGLGESTALLSSIGIGVTNLVFTIIGMSLIDRLGRRQLMYIGSVGYILSLATVSMAFLNQWAGMIVPIALFAFIASHAIGQGSVIWVFIAEIFPNHLRAYGQGFGSSTHWVLAALIPALIPYLFRHPNIGAWMVFAFFAFMMVLQLLFVAFLMPETKGVPLEELQARLIGQPDNASKNSS
ncbi:MAG: MFS transporter, partial [Lewinella sp.]|nr:MFS transporter [Lewinella sp.]